MTKEELTKKIADINHDPNASREEKQSRINQVNAVYERIQTQTKEASQKSQQEADAQLKASLKAVYMSNPAATEDEFERDYPNLKSVYLRSETLKKDEAARAAFAESYRSNF